MNHDSGGRDDAISADFPKPGFDPAANMPPGRAIPLCRGQAATWRLSGRIDQNAPLQEVHVSALPFTIGRRPDNYLCLANATISGRHAELVSLDNQLFIKDLESTNGAFVNGKRIVGAEMLRDGDRLQLGTATFVVRRQQGPISFATLMTDVGDRAQAYLRFEKLMGDPAVVPFFQPIVRLDGSQSPAYEVLARSHLVGLETPETMFQVATDLNSEVQLSCLLRREGLRHGSLLGSRTPLYLNTHPSEIGQPGLLESLKDLRREFSNLSIVLEIHEAAITSASFLARLRDQLRDLDIRLAYDDFGAGQARLLEMADAPPDVIKFDIHMIRGLPEASAEKRHLVASLVQIVWKLGAVPLAEGVETADEAAACRDLGFELGQGYFFGYPAPVGDWLVQSVSQTPFAVPSSPPDSAVRFEG
ncbi:MAG: EAL domain-containing protein [Thermoguttaceae bacterium]